MDKKLIDRYIALPLVINVFKQDEQNFQKFKMRNVYLDLLDAAIDKASSDFYNLKRDIISKNHLDIKKLDGLTYTINGELVEYSAQELKNLTNDLMEYYISTCKVDRKIRRWD